MKLYGLAGLMLAAMLTGCGGNKIDENKPLDQVAADAAQMGRADLQKMVDQYKVAIADKGKELDAVKAKIKEIPITEMMGDKAKMLKDDVSRIAESTGKLKDQLAVYAKELSAKQ